VEKQIKCLLLNVDDVIITEVNDDIMPEEIGDPDWMLINPYKIDASGNLTLWPTTTDQRKMKIHSDKVLTSVDPKPEIIEKYLELTEA
jgi:hypothetical protein